MTTVQTMNKQVTHQPFDWMVFKQHTRPSGLTDQIMKPIGAFYGQPFGLFDQQQGTFEVILKPINRGVEHEFNRVDPRLHFTNTTLPGCVLTPVSAANVIHHSLVDPFKIAQVISGETHVDFAHPVFAEKITRFANNVCVGHEHVFETNLGAHAGAHADRVPVFFIGGHPLMAGRNHHRQVTSARIIHHHHPHPFAAGGIGSIVLNTVDDQPAINPFALGAECPLGNINSGF